MIDTSNKKDFGWGNKIPTPSPSNLSKFTRRDHSVVVVIVVVVVVVVVVICYVIISNGLSYLGFRAQLVAVRSDRFQQPEHSGLSPASLVVGVAVDGGR